MTENFSFHAFDVGLPSQCIIFQAHDKPERRFDVPDMVMPQDQEERFWALYNKLVELEAIPNRMPVFNTSS